MGAAVTVEGRRSMALAAAGGVLELDGPRYWECHVAVLPVPGSDGVVMQA